MAAPRPTWRVAALAAVLGLTAVLYLTSAMYAANPSVDSDATVEVDAVDALVIGGRRLDSPAVRKHLNTFSLRELWPVIHMWTMVSQRWVQFVWDAVETVNKEGIEGDIVEAGVWKGGCTMAMVLSNMRHNTHRNFWLFDTFDGLPPPSKEDDEKAKVSYDLIQKGLDKTREANRLVENGKWNYGPLPVVMNAMAFTNYPRDKFHFIKGKVEDTLPVTKLPDKIAILRLDTDWYLSTKAELEYMYERLQPGGLLFVDDFCSWGGSRKAVAEFFEAKGMDAFEIAKEEPCLHYWKK